MELRLISEVGTFVDGISYSEWYNQKWIVKSTKRPPNWANELQNSKSKVMYH